MLRKPFLLLILLLSLPLVALAQPGSTITIGETVTGTLTAASPSARYTLEGLADVTITILLTSETFDSFLTLLGSDGTELASDDDSGGGKNARITDFTLPADGTYTIVVESYNRVSSGDYELSVTGMAPTPAPFFSQTPVPTEGAVTPSPEVTAQPGAEISYDEAVTGMLNQEAPSATYVFLGSEGDVLTITATSDDFDTFLTLRDAGGVELASDDDRAGNLNAQIQRFVLPADGTYRVTVSSYNNASTGDFTLLIEAVGQAVESDATPTPILTETPAVETTAETTEIAVTEAADSVMTIGDTRTGTLTTDATSADYTFEGRAGQVVTITLTSDDFDAYLLLRDSGGQTIASNDDGAGDYNARIEAVSLPADDTYTIVASSYTNAETGSYTLALDSASATAPTALPAETNVTATPTPLVTFTPTPTPFMMETAEATAEAGNTITVGESVTGTLTGESDAYVLEGEAGEYLTITLDSDQFDAYLRLIDSSGREIASDDDSGGGLNAQIGLIQLPADGRYTIVAESFSDEAGDYTLTVSSITLTPIEYTQTVQGRLTTNVPVAVYRFTGQAGDVVTISADSHDFDAYLTLSQPDSSVSLMEDDDSGGSLNALIGPYTLPVTGDYLGVVSSTDGSMGEFSLSLLKTRLTQVAYGDRVMGEFQADTPALYYSFEAAAGDMIHIRVDSGGTLDTSLSLRGPDGYEVAFDDDSGPGNDPEINRLVLNQEGVYTILIKPFAVGQTGRINLIVTREILASLDEGTQQVQLNEKQAQNVLTFTGTAGQRARLHVRVLDNTASAPAITVSQDGQTLASGSAATVSALMLEFVVPSDGAVNVQISDIGFSRVTLELTLEHVEE